MDALTRGRRRLAAAARTWDGARAPDGGATARRAWRRPERLLRLLGRRSVAVGDAAAIRRRSLLVYTAASILLGLGLLVWTTLSIPLAPAIDPRLPGTAVGGSGGGLLLWVMFGLFGSLRVLRVPGSGGFLTFHLPFIGAAMALGGPTAGAWVAFLSTIERRELESQPWYGILANHFVMVVGAVAGGLTTTAVTGLLGGSAQPSGEAFAATIVGTLVLAAVTTAMAVVTIVLRDELSVSSFLELLTGQFGRITALEVALAWVLSLAYAGAGWWTPVVIGVFVLLIWDNHPMPPPDALTGLLAAQGFSRRMEGGLGRLRRGLTQGATLLTIDLDYFKTVNDRFGHALGDEVLAEVGVRLLAQARRQNDLAGRLGGDEFALFLPGLDDADTAMRRADEVYAAITRPIATSAGPVSLGASIGVVVLASWGGVPSTGTVLRHADQAMFHAKRAGGGAHRFDPAETAPFEAGRTDGRG